MLISARRKRPRYSSAQFVHAPSIEYSSWPAHWTSLTHVFAFPQMGADLPPRLWRRKKCSISKLARILIAAR
jgi:hypothetical protein